jgi:hypothetical protein
LAIAQKSLKNHFKNDKKKLKQINHKIIASIEESLDKALQDSNVFVSMF